MKKKGRYRWVPGELGSMLSDYKKEFGSIKDCDAFRCIASDAKRGRELRIKSLRF